jgi:hypothetical protein
MKSFEKAMVEYKKQIKKGDIQLAYKGLMDYFNSLRLYFEKKYPNHSVSGSVYHGYMDMSYFSFTPKTLRQRKLKIAIVFLHEAFRFDVWLGGANKKVQNKYWKLIKEKNWNKYSIPSTIKGSDSIIEYVVAENPDFSDLDALTKQIENGTLKFIKDIENHLP